MYSKGKRQGFYKIIYVAYCIFKLIYALILDKRIKNIYAINPISGIVALLSSFLTRKRYIYESHEMVFGLNYPFFRGRWRHFWRVVEKIIIKNAKYFFTTDSYRLTFISRYYKLTTTNIGYILNVPLKSINLGKKEKNKKSFNFGDKFVLSYCGTILESRGIEFIIDAYARFKDKADNTLLLLAGAIDNSYLEFLKKRILTLDLSLDDVIFTGKLDNNLLLRYISASDVTFALYSNVSLNNRMCSPNKIFDVLHARTEVIATHSFITNDIVLKNNIGVILDSIDTNNILLAIEESYSKRINIIHNNIWDKMKLKYCWESEFDRVNKSILTIFNS